MALTPRVGRSVGFRAATILIAIVVTLPIGMVLAQAVGDSEGLWPHLVSTVLPTYLGNTVLLALGVGILSVLIGVSTAGLVTFCSFPGRRVLRWALLLPLAAPAYLNAYALTDLLQFSGPVQSALRAIFGWGPGEYWFPAVRSLPGAVVILSLALYPYVYLAARTAFLEQSVCVLEVGRTLGLGPVRSFLRLALPLARPSIAVGLSLVLMETLAEFGAVQYCAVDTFATGIYRTFLLPSSGALTASAQLSACLLGLVALLLLLEARATRRARFHHTSLRYRPIRPVQLGRAGSVGAVACCVAPILAGFGVPLVVYAGLALREGDARGRELFFEIARNSVVLGLIASLLAVGLSVVIALSTRMDASRWSRGFARLAGIGYAMPGGVIAIGIIATVVGVDRTMMTVAETLLGTEVGWILTGTILATIYAYQTRFLTVSLGFVQAGLTRIRPSLDGAARTLGASSSRVIRSVHLPLLRGSLAAAGLLVFVDVVKELPATMIMRPFGFDTLAVRVHQLASDERLGEAATGALVILLLGLLPVLLLARVQERSRPGDLDPSGEPPREAADGSAEPWSPLGGVGATPRVEEGTG